MCDRVSVRVAWVRSLKIRTVQISCVWYACRATHTIFYSRSAVTNSGGQLFLLTCPLPTPVSDCPVALALCSPSCSVPLSRGASAFVDIYLHKHEVGAGWHDWTIPNLTGGSSPTSSSRRSVINIRIPRLPTIYERRNGSPGLSG